MLTRQETDVYRGKLWSATGKPMRNWQTAAVELWHSTHTGFSAVTTPPPLFVF